ncbi:MAG: DUF423 domain-containing protein [Acidobacteriota bacterium]
MSQVAGSKSLTAGGLMAALAVAGGAFGAHGLEERLEPAALELWNTAFHYLMVSALGTLAGGVMARLGLATAWGSACLAGGGLIFAGTVAALALGGPRWLGAITPIGGTGLIIGFLGLAWAGWRGRSRISPPAS